MAEITKYNVYLSEQQARKVDLLAATTGREPEEVVNEAVYSYLVITDPFAEDREPPEAQHEVLFYIPDALADNMMHTLQLEDYDSLDEYIKSQVMAYFTPKMQKK